MLDLEIMRNMEDITQRVNGLSKNGGSRENKNAWCSAGVMSYRADFKYNKTGRGTRERTAKALG